MKLEMVEFTNSYYYNTLDSGITVPAILQYNSLLTNINAKIDTGAQFCVFERIHGEGLGLEIESGTPLRMTTATGGFDTFGHTINLSVLGIETESIVYFASEESFYLNILGRVGWLNRVKFGLIDYEGKLLLSAHGE